MAGEIHLAERLFAFCARLKTACKLAPAALKAHQLQFHHIFPKAQLKGIYTSREADDIANLSFVGGKTNRAISETALRDWRS